jgi:hypothetical protein
MSRNYTNSNRGGFRGGYNEGSYGPGGGSSEGLGPEGRGSGVPEGGRANVSSSRGDGGAAGDGYPKSRPTAPTIVVPPSAPAPQPNRGDAYTDQYGAAPTVDRTGFGAYAPKTTLGSVNSVGVNGQALNPNDNTARGAQARLLQALEAASQGQGPSAAQAQLQAGTESNIRAAMAMAASQRGGSRSGAARAAIGSAGLANQQQANQSAQLRAQEMQAAYGLMGQTAGQIRDSDQQVEIQNMQKDLQMAVEQGRISSTEAQTIYNSHVDALTKEAAMRNDYNIARGNANVNMRGQNMTSALGWENSAIDAQRANEAGQIGREDNRVKRAGQNAQLGGAGIGALGSIAGAAIMASDERLKTDIEDVSSKDVKEFLAAVNPKYYDYKDQKHGKGRYTGYMAQDIEKTKIGKTIVREDESGTKYIDLHAMQGAQLATMKHVMAALESKKNRRGRK